MLQITWLTAALVWGTLAVLGDRDFVDEDPDHAKSFISEQNTWSFGQIVPVVLLLLPLLALGEVSYGEWRALHSSNMRIAYNRLKKHSRYSRST